MKNLSSILILLLLLSLACMESAAVVQLASPTLVVTDPPTRILPPLSAMVATQEPDSGAVFMITLSGFEPYRARVTSDGLNVRLAPSESAVIDHILARGDEVTVYAVNSNGWGRVSPLAPLDCAGCGVVGLWLNLDYTERLP